MHTQKDPSIGYVPREVFERMKAAPFGMKTLFEDDLAGARKRASAERAKIRRAERDAAKHER